MKRTQKMGLSEEGRRKRRNTLILAAVLAVVFLLLYVIQRKMISGSDSGTGPDSGTKPEAVLQMEGKIIHTMPLDENARYRAEDEDGHYNLVEVKDGGVAVLEADCDNQVCVRTGRIRNTGEVIACLPHRLIIYIEEGGNAWKTS